MLHFAHKEGTSTRINRYESDVQKLVGCFDSGLMTNPFFEDVDQLLPTDIPECLVKSTTAGRVQMKQIIRKL